MRDKHILLRPRDSSKRLSRALGSYPEKVGYLTYIVVGFSAIQSLALYLFGWLPLHTSAVLFVLPAFVCGVVLGILFQELGRLARHGLFAGIVAVAIYDLSRIPFALLGVWGDFIPKIGNWALQTEDAPAVVGYSWRYVGNGGGMCVVIMLSAFFKLRSSYVWRGVLFGVFVFMCLVATLLMAPNAQRLLFGLTPMTFAAGLLGHLIYGYVLGTYLDQQLPDSIPG